MAHAGVPEPVGERHVREAWIAALSEAQALRIEQDLEGPAKNTATGRHLPTHRELGLGEGA
jgi:hypothetical protein